MCIYIYTHTYEDSPNPGPGGRRARPHRRRGGEAPRAAPGAEARRLEYCITVYCIIITVL